MPVVVVIDVSHSLTARLLAPIRRYELPYEYFADGDAALQLLLDRSFAPDRHLVVLGSLPPGQQRRVLEEIAARRPELGRRMIVVRHDEDARVGALSAQLRVKAVLEVPFGVEEWDETLRRSLRRVEPRPEEREAALSL